MLFAVAGMLGAPVGSWLSGLIPETVLLALFAGRSISIETTALFVVGGVTGLLLGNLAGRRLSGPALQKVFAGAIVAGQHIIL